MNTRDYLEPPMTLQTNAQRDAGSSALAIRILFPWHAQRANEIIAQIERGDRDHALELVRGLLKDHGADMPARERRMVDDLAGLLECDEDNDDQPEDR